MSQRPNANAAASQQIFHKQLDDKSVVARDGDSNKMADESQTPGALLAKIIKLHGGSANPNAMRTLDAATGANRIYQSPSDNAPSRTEHFRQTNANLIPGGQDLAAMGRGNGSVTKAAEERVELRKQCARHCKFQGRQCDYCHGIGFEAMSKSESDPSHSVNKARHQMPTPRQSTKI